MTDNFWTAGLTKAICLLSLFTLPSGARAQTEGAGSAAPTAVAADSLRVKMQQDSLQAVAVAAQQQAASDSAWAAQGKHHQDSLASSGKTTATAASAAAPAATSKRRDTRPFGQRLAFNLGTSFWMNATNTFFEFFPSVEYRFPKTLSIGAGPTYIYNRDRVRGVDLHGWGGKIFSRAQLTSWFYAYTEYQGINNEYISTVDIQANRTTKTAAYVDSWFMSLGINLRVGRRRGINLQALYDVLYDEEKSPYPSAWTYRIGFGF